MEKFKTRLLKHYDDFITELESIDTEYRELLNEATSKGNVLETDLTLLIAFAKENKRRLQFAIAERETLN